jgi:indolepyruvate ferredoxin oxidoreductase beta subunit
MHTNSTKKEKNKRMTRNILLAGVGGQGILTIAAIIDHAAMQQGLTIKQAEVHGMSQRGGAVQSHLRISDEEIFSDLIPLGQADLILSLEPMEALRYLPWLSQDGAVVTATQPFINIPNYPDKEQLLSEISKHCKNVHFVNADKLAQEAGSPKAVNVVMAGAAAQYLGLSPEQLLASIRSLFAAKGQHIADLNEKAFLLAQKSQNAIHIQIPTH